MGLEISGAGLAGSGATGGAGSGDGPAQAASTTRPTSAKGWLILTVVMNSRDGPSSRSIGAEGRGLGAISLARQGSGGLGVVDLALRFFGLANNFLSLFAGQTLLGLLLKLAQLLFLLGQIHWNNATVSCTTLIGPFLPHGTRWVAGPLFFQPASNRG